MVIAGLTLGLRTGVHTLHSAQETPPRTPDWLSSTPHLLLVDLSYSSLSPTQPPKVFKRAGVSYAFLAPAWPNLAHNSLSSWSCSSI